jgi:hypothetical protein
MRKTLIVLFSTILLSLLSCTFKETIEFGVTKVTLELPYSYVTMEPLAPIGQHAFQRLVHDAAFFVEIGYKEEIDQSLQQSISLMQSYYPDVENVKILREVDPENPKGYIELVYDRNVEDILYRYLSRFYYHPSLVIEIYGGTAQIQFDSFKEEFSSILDTAVIGESN